eukprot:gene25745-32234_t
MLLSDCRKSLNRLEQQDEADLKLDKILSERLTNKRPDQLESIQEFSDENSKKNDSLSSDFKHSVAPTPPQNTSSNLLYLVALEQLRLILTIPAIPTLKSVTLSERSEILESLKRWTDGVRSSGVTMDAQTLYSTLLSTPFHMAHQGIDDRPLMVALSTAFTTLCPELLYVNSEIKTERQLDYSQQSNGDNNATPILKLAFLSSHFFDHSIGRILVEMFTHMNGVSIQRDGVAHRIQVMVFFVDHRLGEGEVASTDPNDAITSAIHSTFKENFVHLHSHDIHALRRRLAEEKLDFLFYTDIGMDAKTYLLAFGRLATYQAAWWGHPISTGLEHIDYFVSIDQEIPTADTHYSEQMVRLEGVNTVPLIKMNRTQIAAAEINYSHMNLPRDAKIALVLGRLFKIHPDFDHIVVNLVVLDTYPYGGCLTAHDALFNGVPLVTLPAEEFVRGRYALALYEQMEHTSLIAQNSTQYVELAVRLLRDVDFYTQQSEQIL